VAAGADFAIAAKRNPAVWRAISTIPEQAWTPARDMPGAEVARVAYAPAGWPEGTYAVVRRVRVRATDVSADPRARRRRTFAPGQLRLALGGQLDQQSSYSVVVTNIDDDPVSLEPGSASAPRSRSAAKTASSAWRCGTCRLARPRSTRCGCGPRCWR